MLRYEFINKEWIVSPTACRIYRVSAGLSLLLFVIWWVALAGGGGIPPDLRPLARMLVFAGVVGAGVTIVGMEYFLFRFDNSHPLKQVLWFLIMLIPLVGAPLYCFIVYSRSEVLHETYGRRPTQL
jgi:hypothetical protein